MAHTKAGVARLNERADNQDRKASHQALLNWLSNINHHSQQRDAAANRQDGTGLWLLQSDEFQQWLAEPARTMLCQGIPGAGKTILTSIVIDHLQEMIKQDPTVGMAYLYFNYQPRQEQILEDLLGSLVRQLIQNREEVPSEIEELFKSHADGTKRLATKDLTVALKVAVRAYSKVFVVTDALDEYHASSPGALKTFLSELSDVQCTEALSHFATSRYISEITSKFKEPIFKDIRANEDDVLSYVNTRMNSLLRSRISKYPDVQELIRKEVVRATDGMYVTLPLQYLLSNGDVKYTLNRFLLARLHMDSLKGQPRVGDIKRALKVLPRGSKGLDETYDQAMARIQAQQEGDRILAKNILTWVIHAKRALLSEEILEALAVEPGASILDPEMRPELEDLDSLCAGLITVDKDSEVVRLVHYTTQEYFERSSWFPDAHLDITEACVSYLSFDTFGAGACRTEVDLNWRLEKFPLYKYAAVYWGHHAREASLSPYDLMMRFLEDSNKVSACLQVVMDRIYEYEIFCEDEADEYIGVEVTGSKTIYRSEKAFEEAVTARKENGYPFGKAFGIHLTALFGLHKLTISLIEKGQPPESLDFCRRTPLWYAAYAGRSEIVETLIEEYAVDPNLADKLNRTPLSHAAEMDSVAVVVSLLKSETLDPNIKAYTEDDFIGNSYFDIMGKTALHFAAMGGNEELVEKLLADLRVDPNIPDDYGRTALDISICEEHETVALQLLADTRVNANLQDVEGVTLLMKAAKFRLSEVVEAILSKENVEVDRFDGKGWHALSYAAISDANEMETKPIFEMLLQRSAKRIIHELKDSQRAEIINALLKYNVDPVYIQAQYGVGSDNEDAKGRTPLSYAAQDGLTDCVDLLLDQGVDANQTDKLGRTPLSYGAERRVDKGIVKLLLRRDVHADQEDAKGRTPLSYAAKASNTRNVKHLLEFDVDVNSEDKKGRTPLSYAAEGDWLYDFQLPLGLSTGVDSEDDKESTPLSRAAGGDRRDIVELLIESGADVCSKDQDGYSILYYAVKRGDIDLIKILLAKGNVVPDSKSLNHCVERKKWPQMFATYPTILELLEEKLALVQGSSTHILVRSGSPGGYY